MDGTDIDLFGNTTTFIDLELLVGGGSGSGVGDLVGLSSEGGNLHINGSGGNNNDRLLHVVVDDRLNRKSNNNNYWALSALILVFGTAAGNILVCLAIAWERRLQNVTNYFLMSLAITDLMVAILVMPLGILTLVKGKCFLFMFVEPIRRHIAPYPILG